MSTSKPLSTSSESFRKLLGNGNVYLVPPFQRDYSWEEDNWQDLWFDLLALDGDDSHYMGYAVLQDVGDERFHIIDGQQRFATLSIVVLAALKILEEWSERGIEPELNKQRGEELRRTFIGYKSPSSLTTTPKLSLNKNNDDFFQSYLLRLRNPSNKSKLRPSQLQLWKAFEYFHKALSQHFKDREVGADLADFVEKRVGNSLVFTTIQVADDQSAFKVFETLNARGVKLSSTDLLKNYLFSVVHGTSPADLPEVERQWHHINIRLEDEDFTTFLRHYWNSKHPLARKAGLFREIKKGVKERDAAFELLGELEEAAPLYLAFSRPEDPIWKPDERVWIEALTLLGVSQCYSLLFAGRAAWPEEKFIQLLRLCVVLSFRYQTIGGLNPNVLEEKYAPAAVGIRSGLLANCGDVFNSLKDVYPNDEKFCSDFAMKSLNTSGNRWKKLARYILRNLEADAQGQPRTMDDQTASIEHILPENPGTGWVSAFSQEEQEVCAHRLGNLCLLEPSRNREASDKAFLDKVEIYRKSQYFTTRALADLQEWTPTSLRNRQEQQAKRAAHIWRIDSTG